MVRVDVAGAIPFEVTARTPFTKALVAPPADTVMVTWVNEFNVKRISLLVV